MAKGRPLKHDRQALMQILYAALNSEHGVKVECSDVRLMKAALYKLRTKLNDPKLQGLTLRTSPKNPENEVWILFADEATDGQQS